MQFPNISGKQVVLVRSDYNTGHVLDKDFNLHINENQEMYTVFESFESAKEYIDSVKGLNKKYTKVEYTVYDAKHYGFFMFTENE